MAILNLSTNFLQVEANKSGHFVWIDEPNIIINAAKIMIEKITTLI
jgi:hypothetical protein